LIHLGRLRALGTPAELKAELIEHRRESGETALPPPTLEDVFIRLMAEVEEGAA